MTGLVLGSQAMNNTLIMEKFYGTSNLAYSCIMVKSFRYAGMTLAPIIFSAFLDYGLPSQLVWSFVALMSLLAGSLAKLADVFNQKEE